MDEVLEQKKVFWLGMGVGVVDEGDTGGPVGGSSSVAPCLILYWCIF